MRIEVEPVVDAIGYLGELSALFPSVPQDGWEPYRVRYPELFAASRWRLPLGSYVIRSGGTTILVDTGAGPPGSWKWETEWEGRLLDQIDPAEVDLVFLTHLHIDHCGWNTDANARPLFRRYVVSEQALEAVLEFAHLPHVQRAILPVEFETVGGEVELAPGVVAFETPGHYPGHMSLRVGDDTILLGDVAVHPAQLEHPEWAYVADAFPEAATATRQALLPELEGRRVACGHYPGGFL